ncbi:MAG: DUF3784 domain-containing protein [Synergistaceae bacterium]|nr:DUF3784 domain-containing protein [Synergistaceae bacterium]
MHLNIANVAVVLFCSVLGIFLYSGRGSFLIAGYNTMSSTERGKYNRKAISKAAGVFAINTGFVIGGA